MRKKLRLGEMLFNAGVLSQTALSEALAAQPKSGLRLGEFLIKSGAVQEETIIQVVSKQLRVPRFKIGAFPIDPALADLLAADLAQKHKVVPLGRKGGLLHVAMPDPTDIYALDAIESATNSEVQPYICESTIFEKLLASIYGLRTNLDGLMGDIASMEVEDESIRKKVEDKKNQEGSGEVSVSDLAEMADHAPVIRLVNSLLAQAVSENVSDLHISPEKEYVQVRFRIDGKLQEVPAPPRHLHAAVVSRLKILANMDIATTRIPLDGRFTINMNNREINVRVSTLPTIYGENVVMRLLDMSAGIYTMEQLGMVESDRDKVETAVGRPYGMILATGPTGSGKSTSLYAILGAINEPDINIITLEDPVEYRMENIRQVQLNTKAGMTFASGLRSILRQDPDVVMVGEIRDKETVDIAIQAALTGHRLLSTLHTNDSAGAISRMLDMGAEPFMIASSLLVSIAQRLVRRNCPHCKVPYVPDRKLLCFWGMQDIKDIQFMRGAGCMQCRNTGYKGRVGVYEVLSNDEIVQDLIMKRASSQEITRVLVKAGKLRTLREDAAEKILLGLTTVEEATSSVMV